MPHLSFIIPAYNEAARLGASLEKAFAYFSGQTYSVEVIVVNDGSKDATSEIVRAWQERWSSVRLCEQPRNMGKGAAVRRGMLEATGDYRIFSDADFSTPIHETARLLEYLQADGFVNLATKVARTVDVCIGSRGIDTSLVKKHQPKYREMLGKLVNLVVQQFFIPGITDTQCGFKGFRADAAERIFSRARLNGWMFDLESLYIASKLGLRVMEIPVEWYNDERSTVGFRHSFQILREFLAIKRLHRDL
jgi:dolichyl-phosphate beta-glucosyltransferase